MKTRTMRIKRLPQCRQHQRRWRDYNVDKNLKDEWLERLNDLKAFDLRSICEGHPNGRYLTYRSFSHITLVLNDDLTELLTSDWYTYQEKVKEGVDRLSSHPLTSTIIELNYEYRKGDDSYSEYLRLNLDTLPKKICLSEINRDEWFTSNVQAVEEFDSFIYDLLAPKASSHK